MKPHHHFARLFLILGFASLLIACAGPGPRPDNQLQSAEAALKQADAADARKFEPVLLNQASNKVADARDLMDKENYMRAGRLLEQAAVDAQLAGARSETERARRAVAEITRTIDNLREQLNQR